MENYTPNDKSLTLLKRAEVNGEVTDVLFGETIIEVGHIPAQSAYSIVDGAGAALLPGLTDHHIHLRGFAAVQRSLDIGPEQMPDLDHLLSYLAKQPGAGWLRCIGYHESTLGELDRHHLAQISRPLRIQHRSGKVWVLNDAALELLNVAASNAPGIERDAKGRPTGRLFRMDDWLAERIRELNPAPDLNLTAVQESLAAFGITQVTDASHTNHMADQVELARALQPLSVNCMGAEVAGCLKVMLDEDALPDLDLLIEKIVAAHQAGRGVAFHCVTRIELVVALNALRSAGVTGADRIEHGGIIPLELFDDLLELALPVITQPGFIYARGDQYLRQIDKSELGDLYRYRSLCDAGVRVVASSDAPYGPLNPWQVMASAVCRRTRNGELVGEVERVSPEEALSGYLRPEPRAEQKAIVRGLAADLCLLDRTWQQARADLAGVAVTQTWRLGQPLLG